MFTGRTDVEAETPILWPPDAKSWLIWEDPDAGKDWGQEEKGTREDEVVGWHHQLNGHESGLTLGAGDGQGRLACCSSWSRKESDTTEQLNWTAFYQYIDKWSSLVMHTSLDWLLLFQKTEKMSFLPFLWSIYVKCSLYNSGPLETSDNKCVWLWSFCFH